jgi:2'-carboxy-2,3-dihydroxybiphenyl 1,2-dioxygenase small subunit/ferredoxin
MKIIIDLIACKAYANCLVEAPDVFDFSEETGKAIVLDEGLPNASIEDVRRAVDACPTHAISVVE